MTIFDGLMSLAGLGVANKHSGVFIEKVSNAIEGGLKPWQTRRMALAEKDAAITKAEADIEIAAMQNRASVRVLAEELRDQRNIEAQIMKALPNIREDAKPEDMDDDWIANFFDKSRLVSNEEMQDLWAQVLAGEANEPGAFSHRTVNFLATLTKKEALEFRNFCSYNWKDQSGRYFPIIFEVRDNLPVAFTYSQLKHFDAIGLITFESTGSGMGFTTEALQLSYHGQYFDIAYIKQRTDDKHTRASIPAGRVSLTQIGNELASICKPVPDECVVEYVVKHWISRSRSVSCLIPVPKPTDLS
ncbi:DUF2806 domain-containing protein [Hymenobacter siberiensis]|uniref:DUF2806 domain-containing protein n=1 Tax=Hymenobacter siberiensis TaxID=2848396 RepID=UPI001C1DD5CE|nr:DUF2806 domain-containing protein [Hymenobacter siberiensis]